MFTGKLRPFPQSEKRTVPPHIPRPDYADHPQGYPVSEQAVKGSSQIKVLDDEEIEGEFIVNILFFLYLHFSFSFYVSLHITLYVSISFINVYVYCYY